MIIWEMLNISGMLNQKTYHTSSWYALSLTSFKYSVNKVKGMLDHSDGLSAWSLCDQNLRSLSIPRAVPV